MARTRNCALGLAVLLLAAVAATGCGSGGGSDSTTTTVPQTTSSVGLTTTKPVSTTPDKGFTAAQWAKYQTDAKRFKAQNTATLTRVAVCAKPSNPPAGSVLKCVGDSLEKLSAATTTFGATLASFANSVGGSCQQALSSLIGYVVPYEAKIALLEEAVADGDSKPVTSAVAGAKDGDAAAAAVEQSCAP